MGNASEISKFAVGEGFYPPGGSSVRFPVRFGEFVLPHGRQKCLPYRRNERYPHYLTICCRGGFLPSRQ